MTTRPWNVGATPGLFSGLLFQELTLSYHNSETILFAIYPYNGDLI